MSETFADVWDAIEDTPEQAANLKARGALMREIERWTRDSGLTQTQAARQLGITQPRLSDLMRGRIDKFSLDALVNMTGAAGLEVSVSVTVGRHAA
jgi:predicted XRE-type DNA-binding protein